MAVHFSGSVWDAFRMKMKEDALGVEDFTEEMRGMLSVFLCGDGARGRREKFCSAPYEIHSYEEKACVFLRAADDTYRFDFLLQAGKWKLAFIECVTLPVSDIDAHALPYAAYTALPQKEAEIRAEKEISRMIFWYDTLKELKGKAEAVSRFCDGAGECLCARSWVPFYKEKLAYIAYAAWMENRIYGEDVRIERFEESGCQLRFCGHLWRRIYANTGHLCNSIAYSEYMELFEAIWTDRAKASGWNVRFLYEQGDTVLVFE